VELGVRPGWPCWWTTVRGSADRIVNGVAAFHQYGGRASCGFWTAITFDDSAKGEYLGGVIAPTGISSEALLRAPRGCRAWRSKTGKSDSDEHGHAHASGLYYGGGHVDGMLARMKKELGEDRRLLRRRPGEAGLERLEIHPTHR